MRINDGPDILWLSSQHTIVDGGAHPGGLDLTDHGVNAVAFLRVSDSTSPDALVIEGRPERLLQIAREMVRTAELIVEQTMREPSLRALYGLTEVKDAPE